jgi:hypothetical protein
MVETALFKESEAMINPTVGRRVWFWPGNTAGRYNCIDPRQPFDAGVLYVHNERSVNLLVTDHAGFQFTANEAVLLQDDDPSPEGPHATWMPYQKGQARAHADVGTTGPQAS